MFGQVEFLGTLRSCAQHPKCIDAVPEYASGHVNASSRFPGGSHVASPGSQHRYLA